MKIIHILTEAVDANAVTSFLKKYAKGAKATPFMRSGNAVSGTVTLSGNVLYQFKADIYAGKRISPARVADIADGDLRAAFEKGNPGIGVLRNKDRVTSFVVQLNGQYYYLEFKRTKAAAVNPKQAPQTRQVKPGAPKAAQPKDGTQNEPKSSIGKALGQLAGDTAKSFMHGARSGRHALPTLGKQYISKVFGAGQKK